jgi:cation:H+ antiporter
LCNIHRRIIDIHESFLICRTYFIVADSSADGTGMDREKEKNMEKFINNAPFALVIVILVIGFVLLIKGADFFVEGSSSVAKRLHVPSIIIGLTIVAMGTSLPETAVSVSASIAGNNELAVSNVVGSNIFNLMVVIGVCAILATVNVAGETIKRDIPLSLICAGLLMLLGIIGLGDKTGMTLGHMDGAIFVGLFAGYIFYMIRIALKANKEGKKVEIEGGSDEEIKLVSVPVSILFIVGGAIAIAVGGDVTVDAASRIASDLGMSQTLIGLTIVSIGTSLPELVTSIVAARKNEVDMALGNAIGSNIFNILMVLGIASLISPISIIRENIIDLCVLVAFTVCVWIFAGTKKKIGRIEGLCMVVLYAVYAVYIVIR